MNRLIICILSVSLIGCSSTDTPKPDENATDNKEVSTQNKMLVKEKADKVPEGVKEDSSLTPLQMSLATGGTVMLLTLNPLAGIVVGAGTYVTMESGIIK